MTSKKHTRKHPSNKQDLWAKAASRVVAPEGTLLDWLRESGLPGTDQISDKRSWPTEARIRFLKSLCGDW